MIELHRRVTTIKKIKCEECQKSFVHYQINGNTGKRFCDDCLRKRNLARHKKWYERRTK